ncbi:MAG: AzlD domain-containing protein [Pseudomonadota bacterium]
MMPSFWLLLLVMAAAALFCRWAGFFAMRFLPITPRMEAALRATPISVMAAIAALAVAQGGVTDALALTAAVGLTFLLGNDVAAALIAVALAAGMRWVWG